MLKWLPFGTWSLLRRCLSPTLWCCSSGEFKRNSTSPQNCNTKRVSILLYLNFESLLLTYSYHKSCDTLLTRLLNLFVAVYSPLRLRVSSVTRLLYAFHVSTPSLWTSITSTLVKGTDSLQEPLPNSVTMAFSGFGQSNQQQSTGFGGFGSNNNTTGTGRSYLSLPFAALKLGYGLPSAPLGTIKALRDNHRLTPPSCGI